MERPELFYLVVMIRGRRQIQPHFYYYLSAGRFSASYNRIWIDQFSSVQFTFDRGGPPAH
jgi:hypothetical protein